MAFFKKTTIQGCGQYFFTFKKMAFFNFWTMARQNLDGLNKKIGEQ